MKLQARIIIISGAIMAAFVGTAGAQPVNPQATSKQVHVPSRKELQLRSALSDGVAMPMCASNEFALNRTIYAIPATAMNFWLFGLDVSRKGNPSTRFYDARESAASYKRLTDIDVAGQAQLILQAPAKLAMLRAGVKSAGCFVQASPQATLLRPGRLMDFPALDFAGKSGFRVVQLEPGEGTYTIADASRAPVVQDVSGLLFVTEGDVRAALELPDASH